MADNYDLIGVKSQESKTKEYIRFINCSDRKIAVFWINYNGLTALYKILNPSEFVNVNTFVGHPWISLDVKNKERFLTGGKRIYYPEPGYMNRVRRPPEHLNMCRLNIKISAPLRDLRTLSYMCLVKMLSKEEDVDPLDLPETLRKELKKLIQQEHRFENKD
ncbi:von Hippel-Lindau tumor suppressor homolog [Ctenocephalides felis]|uniref:von Hippel-Lindau tumor suppressor homolog n=1 Tax=Ctenocephalides felis TaxID=7515 RepID=UPI000E6E37BB|nr:von Hippel-Lindau tumor suppressor homolog [Ctenocephalides felis]